MASSRNSDLPTLTGNAPPHEASSNGISRRTVIKAGWMVPTVVALELSGVKQVFAISNTGGGNPPQICDCTIDYWKSHRQDWPAPYNTNPTVSSLFVSTLFTRFAAWSSPTIPSSYSLLDALSDSSTTGIRNFLKQFVRLLLCIKKAGSLTVKIEISVNLGITNYNFNVDSGKAAADFIAAVALFLTALVLLPSYTRNQALDAVAGEFAKKNISLVCAS